MTTELLNMDCMKFMETKEDETYDLIIADPPYFEVKGDFDFIWKSFDDYLADVEIWAKEMSRVLKSNGSLLWYGHAKKIAYSQIILDKYFNLENALVWEKNECQTKIGIENFRSFAPVTERILFYSKEIEMTGLQEIKCDERLFLEIKEYLREEKRKSGLTLSELNYILVNKKQSDCIAKRYFGTSLWELPTEEMYKKLQTTGFWEKEYFVIRKEYEVLRKEYEVLRKEYEVLRRPFNNINKYTDVLKFSQEGSVTGKHDHPTQKPPKLTRALASTIGRSGGKAYIPFLGSGVEAIECKNFGMSVDGTEIDEKHYKAACKRFYQMTRQEMLF